MATSRHKKNEISEKSESSSTNVKEKLPKETNFCCPICNNKFDAHNELLEHFVKHGSKEIDSKGRPKQTQHTISKNIHPTAKNTAIQCEWCPEKFPSISQAIQHKHKKHNKVITNYYCEFCGKLFPFRISLIQHQFNCKEQSNIPLISAPATIYNCASCQAKFLTITAKLEHERKSHFVHKHRTTIVPPPSKKIKRMNDGKYCSIYFCYLCGAEYSVKHNLGRHLEIHHTVEERTKFPTNGIIKCKLCDAIFHTKNAYLVHNLHHKKDDIIVQTESEREKMVQNVDQDLDVTRMMPKTKRMNLTYLKKISQKRLQEAEKPTKNKN